jgi:uncharacterized membrane protein YraQ (UPF0718 family)
MDQNLQIFVNTVVAIFLEASPFLFLGAFLSAIFEVYLPEEKIHRYLPKSKFLGLLFGLFAGMLVPTCECGVVPIVRRFLKKDIPPHVSITYMLSAPVINPLVLAATYIAFQGNIWMVVGRSTLVAVCACCLGWIFSGIKPVFLLRGDEKDSVIDYQVSGGLHSHKPDRSIPTLRMDPGCRNDEKDHRGSRFLQVVGHTATEFMDMGKYLILGGIIVGLFKIFLPEGILLVFQKNMLGAVGAMMLFAMLLSVCSEADAFVAAAFSTFPAVARLSFVSIGPMVDIKLAFMYASVFKRKVVIALLIVPTILVYFLSVLFGVLIG